MVIFHFAILVYQSVNPNLILPKSLLLAISEFFTYVGMIQHLLTSANLLAGFDPRYFDGIAIGHK